MRQCVLCGEELHDEESHICLACDPDEKLNYRGVTKAGKNKKDYRKNRVERNSEVSNDY